MSIETTPGTPCPPPQDPRVVSNPPGLPAISYRVDDFTGFRRALLRPLPGEQAISAWRPAPGDLGLQLLEWWAYLADVLTFYNERYANEDYLRTATQQASIANLVALLAYQPAPGIAAAGTLAVVRNASHPHEALVIPASMSLSSTATPGVPAQTFEVDTKGHFPGASNVPVAVPADNTLHSDHGLPTEVLLAGRVSGVKQHDDLLLVDSQFTGTVDNWSAVTVTDVTPAADPATGAINTHIGLSAPNWGPTLTPVSPPQSPVATEYRLLRPTAATTLWSNPNVPRGGHVIGPTPGDVHLTRVHLSASVRDISPGATVFFQNDQDALALGVVIRTSERFWPVPYPGSPTETDTPSGPMDTPSGPADTPSGPVDTPSGPVDTPSRPIAEDHVLALQTSESGGGAQKLPDIPIAHTVLDLRFASPGSSLHVDTTTPAALAGIAVRYGLRDVGTVIGIPATHLTSLSDTVEAAFQPLVPGQSAFLQDKTGAGVLVGVRSSENKVAFTHPGDATKQPPPTNPLPVPLQLLVDLVPVSRGTTVAGEVLGSGNAAIARQSFTLAKSPLTYLASGAGSTSTLTVFVNQIEWEEVPGFFGQTPEARVFVVTRSPDQSVTTVTFGDGVNGARLPSGTENVTANYRYGSGKSSPPAGRLNTISEPQVNLASIQNPVAVSGGADPEAPDDVRASAPVAAATFGRAISATDYEYIAAHAPGVSRAAAYWEYDPAEQRTLVKVYVGDDDAARAAAIAALAGSEDPSRPVKLATATPIPLSLTCALRLAPGYQAGAVVAAATAALSGPAGLFSPGRMGIGQRLYRSAVDAALLVPGVVAVENLTVTRQPQGDLEEVLDPGRGGFFTLQLQPGSIGAEG
jgi:phage-related baseplate assembly protein